MKNEYLDEVTELLKQTSPKLAVRYRLEFKHSFGAIAGYVNGQIFISYGKFGVALKLPSEILTVLFKDKVIVHLKYFQKGYVKKEYAVLSKQIIEDQHRFKELLDKSIKYVLSKNS